MFYCQAQGHLLRQKSQFRDDTDDTEIGFIMAWHWKYILFLPRFALDLSVSSFCWLLINCASCRYTPGSQEWTMVAKGNPNWPQVINDTLSWQIDSSLSALVSVSSLILTDTWCSAPRRTRRREKLALIQNWSFRYNFIRANYWACIVPSKSSNYIQYPQLVTDSNSFVHVWLISFQINIL